MTRSASRISAVDALVVGPFQENVFLLHRADRAEVVLIDPGDEPRRIMDVIESHGWTPVAIVNTHAHLDHVGAVAPLKRHYGIPFYLHANELSTLMRAPADARLFGVPEPEVPAVDATLEPGIPLQLAGLTLEVRFTPGHTPGGVSLVVDGRVFAGDALFSGSIGRTDLPGGDTATLLASIREQLLDLPDETIVHSGHGPDTTIGHERLHNPFLTGRFQDY